MVEIQDEATSLQEREWTGLSIMGSHSDSLRIFKVGVHLPLTAREPAGRVPLKLCLRKTDK
jgi:hypothetical protein